MWWLRRPKGALAAPPLSPADLRGVPMGWWAAFAAMAVAMPVFGWSLLVMVALEALRWFGSRRPRLA
jgi:sulfite reductase (NADPH) flavoprotein alpha-component